MDRSKFEALSIAELGDYLLDNKVSQQTVDTLRENRVSGLALLLVNHEELKELFVPIGDRAVVRKMLHSLQTVK